ncbi:MAG TPA: TetR/AcrR family transcriptional regulator C-terminal domain-containing protein, partial [Streptosporangiaceae bacterium]|nr:TetR/AcrR family transcriptional regulator C-terminal domain-containing protein [Streptosporangiaceae bacterium]
ATMRAGHAAFADQVFDDIEMALRFVADAVWTSMHRDRDVLRVLLRDLDDFPDLKERVWAEIRANVYDVFTAWLTAQAEHGTVRADDQGATAAVLLASLTYAPILDALIGHTPGDVEPERFQEAWIRHALVTLRPAN